MPEIIDISKIPKEQEKKPEKKTLPLWNIKMSEDLIIAIPQYKTVDYTIRALNLLRKENIPFTSLVVFDGTPGKELCDADTYADIYLRMQTRVSSMPHLWNLMFGIAKLTKAKYLLYHCSDIEIRPGALQSMYNLIKRYDVVSPIKIDGDRKKFENYKIGNRTPLLCAGMNDAICMYNLAKIQFKPFNEIYAPYQFCETAYAYELWRSGCSMVIDPGAVVFHYGSVDIANCPAERKFGSETWDQKRDYFMQDADNEKRFFLEKSIMNSANANIYGFPVHVYGPIDKIDYASIRAGGINGKK